MRLATTMALVTALVAVPASAVSSETMTTQESPSVSAPVIVKSLTDYPGRTREVTETQKAEIRAVLERLDGNTKFICTGASVNFYYSNDENLKQVEALAVEEQVAEKLLESAKAKTIDMSYADVMKSRQS